MLQRRPLVDISAHIHKQLPKHQIVILGDRWLFKTLPILSAVKRILCKLLIS